MGEIDTVALQALLRDTAGFVLLHASGPKKFAKEHIAQSVNVPADAQDFVDRVHELTRNDRHCRIVVYAADGDPAAARRALERLARAGFGNVSHYAGGIRAWREAGIMLEGQPGAALEDA